jgi:glycosyltransferase involved in cell wall biosynthesis
MTYRFGVQRFVDRLRAEYRFDLIHAYFTYPDGVAAVHLGKRYGVPVVITEHAPWGPGFVRHRLVTRKAIWASTRAAAQIAVSTSVRDQIVSHTGRPEAVRVIPNGVDGSEFTTLNGAPGRDPNQILYVGHLNAVKGVDVLLKAMKLLIARRPRSRLVLFGATYYRTKERLAEGMLALAEELQLGGHVEFLDAQPPVEVARYMRESSVLVLPSRAESFGCVLIEALACGTPVVATRCGGPEDIVHDGVGRLVPTEDPPSLAAAIDEVLDRREEFEASRLRGFALEKFSWDSVAERTVSLYHEALGRRASGRATAASIAARQG